MAKIRDRLYRRSPLLLPSGTPAGFDPGHTAALNTYLSAIPLPGGTYIDLLSGRQGTAASGPVFTMTSRLGSAVNFAGATANVTFPQNLITTSGTIGVFFQAPSWAGTQVIVHTSGASSVDGVILFGNAGVLTVQSAGSNASTGIALAANTPYFAALSFTFTGSPLNELAYLVLVNLATGMATVNSGLAINTPGTSGGTGPVIGNYAPKNLSILGTIGPVAFTNGFTPLAGLRRWAEDPWSFWYPRIGINTHFYGQVSSGVSGTLAATEAADIAAFTGTFAAAPSVTGILSALELPDVVAFAGSVTGLPTGSLLVTEAADTARFTLTFLPLQARLRPSAYDYGWEAGKPTDHRPTKWT